MDFYSKLSQFCVLIIYKIKVLIMDFYSKLSIINYQLQKYGKKSDLPSIPFGMLA